MGEFPSGQRGQTVNLLRIASMVRIRPPPPEKDQHLSVLVFFCFGRRIRKGRPRKHAGGMFSGPWPGRSRANPSSPEKRCGINSVLVFSAEGGFEWPRPPSLALGAIHLEGRPRKHAGGMFSGPWPGRSRANPSSPPGKGIRPPPPGKGPRPTGGWQSSPTRDGNPPPPGSRQQDRFKSPGRSRANPSSPTGDGNPPQPGMATLPPRGLPGGTIP